MITVTRGNNDNQALDATIQESSFNAIARAAKYLQVQLRLVLNGANPLVRVKLKGGPNKGRRIGRYLPQNSSKPGEPPRKRTGFLQKSVEVELDKERMTARVGIGENAIYGLFLELGTVRMRPRPWLKVTVTKLLPELKALLASEESA